MDGSSGSGEESEEGIELLESGGTFTKFPHLDSLNKHADILDEREVVVTEKLDGTSWRVGIVDGRFTVGSRGMVLSETQDNFDFYKYVVKNEWERRFEAISEDLKKLGFIVYGEYCGAKIVKKMNYHEERKAYAYQIRINGDFIQYDAFAKHCDTLSIPTVPLLFRGKPDREKLIELRQGKSLINENEIREGIVITPSVHKRDHRGNWMIYKLKAPEYEERMSLKASKPTLDNTAQLAAREFANEFVTDMRLEHVVAHLHEKGIKVSSMSDTKQVLAEMTEDCLREGAAQIPEGTTNMKPYQKEISNKTIPMLKKHLGLLT